MKKILYEVTTSYDGDENFGRYYVIADNGIAAASIVNVMKFKKRSKVQHERADEVRRIADIDYETPEPIIVKRRK